jgi:hypothetical protein
MQKPDKTSWSDSEMVLFGIVTMVFTTATLWLYGADFSHDTNHPPVITSIESAKYEIFECGNSAPQITDIYFTICSKSDVETELCCLARAIP